MRPSGREAVPQPGAFAAFVRGAVEEVRDDADVAVDAELAVRVGLEALGNRRDAVRLRDAERHGLGVRPIVAEQRDVGTVQGRNHTRHGFTAAAAEDLPREIRRRRVRDGVMRMDDVELLVPRHLHNLVRQRQEILRLAEQRVRRRLDTMKRQPRLVVTEAERRVAAQDMNVMAARRQRLPELGGDDAAPADRRVADDADVHGRPLRSPDRTTGSRTMTPSAHATPASAPNCASRLSMSCLNAGVFSRVGAAASARTN